ncbi:MFS transporter [Sandaracinobacteroides hominis]|uniref:MFS transporter n=1 Tax=Sandaracinobacteroides hominis TaxID=2780086 RepID=UPI0018F6A37B|nr:MFS transporter [Sandaracinobacteroides hominis]
MAEAATLTAAEAPAPRAGLGVQIGYGFGQIAGQIFRELPSLLLLFFMTNVLGIAPALAGAAIFIPKLVWGATADILVGIYSDRWRHKIPRRWWLLVGVVGAPIAMVLLFHVPAGSTTLKVAYVSAVFALYMGVFAAFSVPYLAMASEYTSSPEERNVIMAWRLVFTAIGITFSGMIAPYLVGAFGGDQAAFEKMSIVLAIVCPAALLVTFIATGRVKSTPQPTALAERLERMSFRQAIAVLTQPRFATLISANLLLLTGSGMALASMLYFLTYNMGRTDALQLIGGIVGAACLGIVIAQPLWVQVAKRVDKVTGFLIAAALYGSCYAVWAFAAGWGIATAFIISFIAAVGQSGWSMLGFSMVSDFAAEDERNAGLYSATWIAVDKIAFALGGTLLVGIVLSLFGFDSMKAVQGLPQTDQAMTGVMVAFGISPAVLSTIACLILLKFRSRD